MSSSLYKSGTPCVSAARSETDIAFSAPSRLTYLPQRLFLRCFPCSSPFLSRNIFVTRLGERGQSFVADLIAQSIALVKPALRMLSDGNDITPRCVASAVWGWVYVLKLQDDCWYVGYSADPETRIACHFLGRGARWTQLHAPIAVESLQPGTKKLEDVITSAMMVRHGFQQVRGGQYVIVDLPCPPPPILAAYSIRPHAPAAAAKTVVETLCGYVVQMTHRLECGDTAWMARVAGEKALKYCPSKGFKTIYASDEVLLRESVLRWLEDA